MVNRFANALELHDYLQAQMPWQAPGTLTAEEYWQLTAYLVRLNGLDPGPVPLDEQSAAKVLLRNIPTDQEKSPASSTEFPWFWAVTGFILVAVGIILLVKYIRIIKLRQAENELD